MKQTIEKIFDLLKNAALLKIVANNKIDEQNPQLPNLIGLVEEVERELNQALSDVRKIKDESEPKAQLFLKVLLEQQLPEKGKRLSDLEQQLRSIE